MITMFQTDINNVISILNSVVPENILENELQFYVTGPSKRIRSELALSYYRTLGCDINEKIYKLLAIGELIHNASLLHDDVIDDAEIRRGNIALNRVYGSKISVLSGDYLLSIATELLQEIDNSHIAKLFSDCLKNMCEAEINQYLQRGKIPSESEYIKICEGKTAKLFSVILESAAILLNADRKNAKIFGMNYGLMFQIKNDLELTSAENDKKNDIYTAIDVMGIEKTNFLLDNCRGKLFDLIKDIPQNKYKIRLEDLIRGL